MERTSPASPASRRSAISRSIVGMSVVGNRRMTLLTSSSTAKEHRHRHQIDRTGAWRPSERSLPDDLEEQPIRHQRCPTWCFRDWSSALAGYWMTTLLLD